MLLRSCTATCLLLLAAAHASAQTGTGFFFNRPGSGARAAGMANAFTAVSDDGTAASWNPAGLGQLRKPELSVVGTTFGRTGGISGFRTRDDLAAFTSASSSYQSTTLDFASLAVPATLFRKPITFQGAWRRLYYLDYREVLSFDREPLTPAGPPSLRVQTNTDLLGAVDLVSIAGALKATPRLALGASFNIWRADWSEDISTSTSERRPETPARFSRTRQHHRVDGETVSLGLMLTYPSFSVGLLHQSPLSGPYRASAEAERSDVPGVLEQDFTGSFRFARSWTIGGAWRPSPRWTAALDFTRDDWTQNTLDTPQTGRVSLFDGLPPGRSATRDTLSVNAGAECLLHGEGFVVPLRFGAAWEPQGGRSPYTRDSVAYVMLAAGTGYNTNSLKFDAALQYRWTSFRDGAVLTFDESATLELPSAVGERHLSEWRLKFSVILRVTDTDKLRRTLGKVFGGG